MKSSNTSSSLSLLDGPSVSGFDSAGGAATPPSASGGDRFRELSQPLYIPTDPFGTINKRLLMPRAAEEAGKGVVIFVGYWVELVVVAAGTRQREAQKRLGDHIDLVVDPPHLLFANVNGGMSSLPEEVKPGPQDRLVEALNRVPARRLEQVSGDLLGQEPVVRQVGVEGANDVIAVAKRVHDVVVELVAGGLGVADQVEPVAGPPFAESGLASRRSTSRS